MQLKNVFLCGLLSLSANSFAIEAWNGSKILVNNTHDKIQPFVVSMNSKHGTVSVGTSGSSVGHGSFSILSDTVNISLKEPLETNYSVAKVNPSNGMMEQVKKTIRLSEFTITQLGDKEHTFTGKGETCYTFYSSEDKECEEYLSEYDNNLFTEIGIRDIRSDFSVGDKVVLPVTSRDVMYLQIQQGGLVKNLLENNEGEKVTNLQKQNGIIIASLNDGSTITYSRLRLLNGDEMLLGVKKDSNSLVSEVIMGNIVVDENVNTRALDFSGSYSLVGFGSQINSGDEFIINFIKDGFGGFDFYNFNSDESLSTIWSWEETANGMRATRWIKVGEYGTEGMAETKEEVEACKSGEIQCVNFQNREYRIIAKDGNKFTMLRTLNHMTRGFNDTDNIEYTTSFSINYLYKK